MVHFGLKSNGKLILIWKKTVRVGDRGVEVMIGQQGGAAATRITPLLPGLTLQGGRQGE